MPERNGFFSLSCDNLAFYHDIFPTDMESFSYILSSKVEFYVGFFAVCKKEPLIIDIDYHAFVSVKES